MAFYTFCHFLSFLAFFKLFKAYCVHDQDLGGDPSVRGLLERSGGRALCCGPGVGLIRLAGASVGTDRDSIKAD